MSVVLPPDFDVSLYRNIHPDLLKAGFDDIGLANHYLRHGKEEGRICSNITNRNDFCNIFPFDSPILEIRPGFNPLISGNHVFYFETMYYSELLDVATGLNVSIQHIKEPNFVSTNCDLSVINRQFPAIVSNHDLGKHPDFLHHIIQIEQLLTDDGLLFCVLPDKKYSSSYFYTDTTIASVVAARMENRTTTPLQSVIEQATLTTHNHTLLHWLGDHGTTPKSNYKNIKTLLNNCMIYSNVYNRDIQTNSFTADGFTELMNDLYQSGLTKLKVIRNYKPVRLNNEFYVVLQKD